MKTQIDLSMYEGEEREAISVAVQEKMFLEGHSWALSGTCARPTSVPYLLIFNNKPDIAWDNKPSGAEITLTAKEYLNGTKQFKPYDKVLARNTGGEWFPTLFSAYTGMGFNCMGVLFDEIKEYK